MRASLHSVGLTSERNHSGGERKVCTEDKEQGFELLGKCE